MDIAAILMFQTTYWATVKMANSEVWRLKNFKRSNQRRFSDYALGEKIVGFGNFLDPRLKGIHLDQVGRMEAFTNSVKRAILTTHTAETEDVVRNEKNNNPAFDVANLTPTERVLRKKFNPLSDVFDTKSQEVKAAEKELELYKSLPLCSKEGHILEWWKAHSDVLPRLTAFAKHILGVPASSSSSEQLFSIAGLFDSVKRVNMRVDTLETITLLKVNQKLLSDNKIDFKNDFVSSEEDGDNDEQGSDDVGSDDSVVQEMEEASDLGEMEDQTSDMEDDMEEEDRDKGGKEYEEESIEELE